jgi:hypothetical protein
VAVQAGQTERVPPEIEAIFRRKGHPLFSRETAVVTLTYPPGAGPGEPSVTESFRRRGGCCRAYTRGEGSYCTSCVLRTTAEQDARWLEYLAERLAGIPRGATAG